MTAPSPLYLACRELIEAVDRILVTSINSDEWLEVNNDAKNARDKIRALLAGEEP